MSTKYSAKISNVVYY